MTIDDIILGQTKFKAKREGIKEAKQAIVLRMLKKESFTDDEIIELAQVTPTMVRRIKSHL